MPGTNIVYSCKIKGKLSSVGIVLHTLPHARSPKVDLACVQQLQDAGSTFTLTRTNDYVNQGSNWDMMNDKAVGSGAVPFEPLKRDDPTCLRRFNRMVVAE